MNEAKKFSQSSWNIPQDTIYLAHLSKMTLQTIQLPWCIGIFHFKPRYLGKYPDFNVWWGGSHLTGLSHTAVQLLCYFHREGCPLVQKKSKLSCLGREGHGMTLSISLISCRNDPFVTAGFLESLGIEKFLYKVIKITNILHPTSQNLTEWRLQKKKRQNKKLWDIDKFSSPSVQSQHMM